jgi:hypothetical protein
MPLSPEQKLWRAVLEQAYIDAEVLSGDPDVSPKEHLRARTFLCAEDPYDAMILALICDFAELPADRLVLWARRRYQAVVGPAF